MPFTSKNDINVLQQNDAQTVGAGGGDDRYILTLSTLSTNQKIQISDAQGSNVLHLVGGLVISASKVASDTLLLKLTNGAEITILGASSFTFQTGGDSLSAIGGSKQNFTQFVTQSLGTSVPVGAAILNGKTVTVNDSGGTTLVTTPEGDTTGGSAPSSLFSTAQTKSYTDNNIDTLPSANDSLVRTVASSYLWQKQALTYGFNQTLPSEYLTDNDLKSQINQWQKLNTTETNVARAAIDRLGQLTPLTFTEASGNSGDIRFNVIYIPGDTAGFAYMPTNGGITAVEGDVFLDSEMRSQYKFAAGDQGYMTVWHELGHAMGLEHPFEGTYTLSKSLDNWANSIMSYTPSKSLVLKFTASGNSANVAADYNAAPADFTLLDVAALQAMYGANTNYATGDNTYSVDAVNKKTLTIWDAGGNDTIDASTATGQSIIDMRAGQLASIDIQTIAMQAAVTKAYYQSMGLNGMDSWVDSVYATPDYASKLYTGENNLVITYGTIIENVKTGAGNDTVKDNAVNNTITTGSGDDAIYLGRGGFDTVNGGSGTDTVYLDVLKADVQTGKLDNGNFLLVGSGFAAELIGVEQIRYGNGEIFTV
ncbi:M10 family metallopeptidase [Aquaspirillum soli]